MSDKSQYVQQFSLKTDSFTLSKKLNDFFFNSSFYRVDDFLQATTFNNLYDTNSTINATYFKEKLKSFQIDLVKRRNSLCLFEIHKRFDWSFIKLDTNVLKNFTSFDNSSEQRNNDSYFNRFIKKMDETVSSFLFD